MYQLDVVSVRRRPLEHWSIESRGESAWMIRAIAVGLGGDIRVHALLAWGLVAGPPGDLGRALLMGTGWGINVILAESAIRSRVALAGTVGK